MLALTSAHESFSCEVERRQTGSVSPTASPPRVPTKSGPANHPDRSHHHGRRRLNYDHPPVKIATTIRATMCALAATFCGLSTEACEAQQGGEC